MVSFGPEFTIRTTTDDPDNSTSIALSGGQLLGFWRYYDGSDPPDIRARIFDAGDTTNVPDFVVNTDTSGQQAWGLGHRAAGQRSLRRLGLFRSDRRHHRHLHHRRPHS